MATQGLLTVTKGGAVVAKVVSGSDGQRIPELARRVAEERLTAAAALLDAAVEAGFYRNSPSLVVISAQTCGAPDESVRNGRRFHVITNDDLSDRYFDTFDLPGFNPRWADGAADYNVTVPL